MSISDILEMGRQGMQANRQALGTTSNNIANANTPGYSRQRPVLQSRGADIYGGGAARMQGVYVKDVIRVHDSFIEKRIIDEARILKHARSEADSLKRVENAVYSGGHHLGELVNNFFNDYRTLSLSPEGSTQRASIANSAAALAAGFRKTNDALESIQNDIDIKLAAIAQDVNSWTQEMAKVNAAISQFEAIHESPNELYDRRDLLVRQISEKLGTQVIQEESGHVNIVAPGIGILVNGSEFNELDVIHSSKPGEMSRGGLDIILKQPGGSRIVTGILRDGEMGGLLKVRDGVVRTTLDQLDRVAHTFIGSVNDLHRQGVGMDGKSERLLFTPRESLAGAARYMDISDDIKASHENVAAGMLPDAIGDNRLALAMADLQKTEILTGESIGETDANAQRYSFNDSLNKVMGKIAAETHRADNNAEHQDAVVGQLENYKQSISGVSMEEEGVNLIQFQAAFNASVKTMKVADELLQSVLTLKS